MVKVCAAPGDGDETIPASCHDNDV